MIQAAAPKRIRLGDLLVSQQMISEAQLQHALQEQKMTGRKLGASLVDLGYVDENALLTLLSEQLEIPFVDLEHFRFDRDLVAALAETTARRYRVMLLREDDDGLLLGMADPTDIFGLDELQALVSKPLKPAVVRESQLLDILDIAYSHEDEIASLAGELEDDLVDNGAIDLADIITDWQTSSPMLPILMHLW